MRLEKRQRLGMTLRGGKGCHGDMPLVVTKIKSGFAIDKWKHNFSFHSLNNSYINSSSYPPTHPHIDHLIFYQESHTHIHYLILIHCSIFTHTNLFSPPPSNQINEEYDYSGMFFLQWDFHIITIGTRNCSSFSLLLHFLILIK